jgi:hypothetical protein
MLVPPETLSPGTAVAAGCSVTVPESEDAQAANRNVAAAHKTSWIAQRKVTKKGNRDFEIAPLKSA